MPYKRSYKYKGKKKPSQKLKNIRTQQYAATRYKNQNAIAEVAKQVATINKQIAPIKPVNDWYALVDQVTTMAETSSYVSFTKLNDPQAVNPMFESNTESSRSWLEPDRCKMKYMRVNVKYKLKEKAVDPVRIVQYIVSPKNAFRQTSTSAIDALNTPNNWSDLKHYWHQTTDEGSTNGFYSMMLNPRFFTVHDKRYVTLKYMDILNDSTEDHNREYYYSKDFKLNIPVRLKAVQATTTYYNSWRDVQFQDMAMDNQYYLISFHEGFTPNDAGTTLDIDIRVNSQIVVSQARRPNENAT